MQYASPAVPQYPSQFGQAQAYPSTIATPQQQAYAAPQYAPQYAPQAISQYSQPSAFPQYAQQPAVQYSQQPVQSYGQPQYAAQPYSPQPAVPQQQAYGYPTQFQAPAAQYQQPSVQYQQPAVPQYAQTPAYAGYAPQPAPAQYPGYPQPAPSQYPGYPPAAPYAPAAPASKYMVNQPIDALFEGRWLAASIKEILPGGQYRIKWDDGSDRPDQTLSDAEVRPNSATQFRPAGTDLPFQPYNK